MSFLVKITATGLAETIKTLETSINTGRNYRPFLRDVIEPWLEKEFRQVFDTAGNGNWRALKRSTLRSKRKAGYGSQPLIRTGRYRRDTIRLRGKRLRPSSLEITSPVPYAKYLEFGTSRMRPRTVFRRVAQKLRKEISDLWVEYDQKQGGLQ